MRCAVLVLLFSVVSSTAQAGSFQGLDFLPSAISGDGQVVIGSGIGGRWTAEQGVQALSGEFPTLFDEFGNSYSNGPGNLVSLNYDGSVILGSTYLNYFSVPISDPFVWREGSGYTRSMEVVPYSIISSNGAYVTDMSEDGTVIVGRGVEHPTRSFVWSFESGEIYRLIDDSAFQQMTSISGDGRIAVGYGSPNAEGSQRGYRWSASEDLTDLGDFTGGGNIPFIPSAISSDGSAIAGHFKDGTNRRAGITDENGRVERFDLLMGFTSSTAIALSADGTAVIGNAFEGGLRESFYWTAEGGTQSLAFLLASLGLDVEDWTNFDVKDISANGNTIVGIGTNPLGVTQGFIAVIPEPSAALLIGLGLIGFGSRRRGPG